MSLEKAEGIRGRWVYDAKAGCLVETTPPTNAYLAPAIHQDTIDPLQHPATGEYFDSKSAFRRVTKEKGYTEIDCDRTWSQFGERKPIKVEGLREDIEEVKHWYTAAMAGNRDYINANVPQEWRDCEAENPDDITEGIRK